MRPLLLMLLLPALAAAQTAEPAIHAGYRQIDITYRAGEQSRRRQVDIWYPTTAAARPNFYGTQRGLYVKGAAVAPGKHPVVLFSHGYLGMGGQSIFLTEAFARAGNVVLAPTHADSLLFRGRRLRRGFPRFGNPETWTDKTFLDRRDDVVHALDKALKLAWLGKHMDADRIAACGHSLGGYTSLGLSGGWKRWHEKRIKCALLYSPFATPHIKHGGAANITIPCMLQGGTTDFGITPFLPALYAKLKGRRYHLVIDGAGHMAWCNVATMFTSSTKAIASGKGKLIYDYSIAFLDRHLRGKKGARLDTSAKGLTSYQQTK